MFTDIQISEFDAFLLASFAVLYLSILPALLILFLQVISAVSGIFCRATLECKLSKLNTSIQVSFAATVAPILVGLGVFFLAPDRTVSHFFVLGLSLFLAASVAVVLHEETRRRLLRTAATIQKLNVGIQLASTVFFLCSLLLTISVASNRLSFESFYVFLFGCVGAASGAVGVTSLLPDIEREFPSEKSIDRA